MHVPKLICLDDGIEMVIDQTGHVVRVSSDNGHEIKVSSDAFVCPSCGHKVARLAGVPITEGWKPDYAATHAHSTAKFVN